MMLEMQLIKETKGGELFAIFFNSADLQDNACSHGINSLCPFNPPHPLQIIFMVPLLQTKILDDVSNCFTALKISTGDA